MMADLVVCCDGTWNTPDDLDAGLPAPTNVVKIYNALDTDDGPASAIRRYYHPGVGTDGGWWERLKGGGAGAGLGKNVISAYRWLAGAYHPGDRIWLFGFSRGAFTVRSLAGMISRCGLLDASNMTEAQVWKAVDGIYDDYRKKSEPKATAGRPLHGAPAGAAAKHSTPIHFIGVWDTVGALGIPDDMALLNLIDDPRRYEFHDTALSENVGHARHAVALDEKRQSFTPTLWDDLPPHQDLKQVWFPGVHSDVGGGYSRSGLSDGALKWMMDEASAQGLAFRGNAAAQVRPDERDVLHDSWTGVFKPLKSRPRQAPNFAGPRPKVNGDGTLHKSAYDRYDDPPLTQFPYWRTTNLAAGQSQETEVFAVRHWNATGLYLEEGVEYQFRAAGEWLDKTIPCGPDGMKDRKFHIGEAVHMVGSAWGKVETLYKHMTGNPEADLWMTRREEGIDWFALVGMVASGRWFDAKGNLTPQPLTDEERRKVTLNQTFKIGSGRAFTPKASGYLYCFANDAWHFYDNNRGSVRLTVSR